MDGLLILNRIVLKVHKNLQKNVSNYSFHYVAYLTLQLSSPLEGLYRIPLGPYCYNCMSDLGGLIRLNI